MKHVGPISGIATHGNFIATAGYDNKVTLWDTQTKESIYQVSHDHLVNNCAFSPDGKLLVSASSDYTARVWEIPSLKLLAVLSDHEDDVDMAVFSPDGVYIATCALDRKVRIFDLKGMCLQTFVGHTGNVLSLAWTNDSKYIVSSSVDGTLRFWDIKAGNLLKTTETNIRTDSVEIDNDGTVFAGDDFGRIIVIHGTETYYIKAHDAGIKKIVLSTERQLIACLSYDRTMSIWTINPDKSLKVESRTKLPTDIWARAAAILNDGNIVTGTFGGTFATYFPDTDIWDLKNVSAGPAINAICYANNHIYTIGDAGELRQDGLPKTNLGSLCNFIIGWDDYAFTGGQMGELFEAHSGTTLFVHHSPLNCAVIFEYKNKDCLAVGTYTGEILIFMLHPDGSAELIRTLNPFENAVKGISISDNFLFAVCASTDIVWYRQTDLSLVKKKQKAHERIANGCCVISDDVFATISRDRTLRIWGEQDEVYMSPHPNSVKCMAINNERTAILTGSYGGTTAWFDLQSKQWRPMQRKTTFGISSITWDPNQKCFLAASYDGQIYPIFQ